jgi:hypothetical protein
MPNGSFCAGDSLSTSVIVYCQDSVGVAADCCADLQDQNAQCYQSSTWAGDAACASNGTAYPVSGSNFHIPPTSVGKSNTTPGVPAVVPTGDYHCNCTAPKSNTLTTPSLYPSSPVSSVQSSPTPPPTVPLSSSTPVGTVPSSSYYSNSTTPCMSGYSMPSSSIQPSSSYTSSRLPSNWSPTPSPTPTTTTSSARSPIYTGAAVAQKVGAEIFAVAGFAALLL